MGKALSYNSLGLYLGIAFGAVVGEVLLELGTFATAWYGATTLTVLELATSSLVAIGPGLTAMAFAPSPLGFLAGVVLTAVGVAFSTPAFFSAIFATARPSQRGSAAGTAGAFLGAVWTLSLARRVGVTG